MWSSIVGNVAKALPPFNDYLLRDFRESKMQEMLSYLDAHFRSMVLFKGALVYQSYHVLTPEERVQYLVSERKYCKGMIQTQKTTANLVRFDFTYEGSIYSFFTEIPYLENHAVHIDGTENFPLLVIIDKVINRARDRVIIKVAQAPLVFIRSHLLGAKSVSGITYKDFVPTTRMHWGSGGLAKRSANKTPLLLYHLCEYGLNRTLEMFGFNPGKSISIVPNPQTKPGFTHFKIKDGVYIEVEEIELADLYKKRVVLSLMVVLLSYPKFTIEDLFSTNHGYFKLALGQYTYSVSKLQLLYKNAEEHLATLKNLLDPSAKQALESVGLKCDSMHSLLFQVFYKLDEWLIYKPTNLYEKQIGSLDHMLTNLIRFIVKEQYKTMRNRTGVNAASIERFMKRIPMRWIGGSSIFRPNPEACHDNWLLTIGAKRFRSLKPIDQHGSSGTSSKQQKAALTSEVKRAHPSNMVVESLLAIPSSSPIIAGTINPYAKIDKDGSIVRPEIADLVEHVFD